MAPTNLTLKQRLAALATATSSPTAPYDAPPKSPGVDRRRAFFNPTWVKRPSGDGSLFRGESSSRDHASDKLQEVMGRVIYQAGVDFEWVFPLGCFVFVVPEKHPFGATSFRLRSLLTTVVRFLLSGSTQDSSDVSRPFNPVQQSYARFKRVSSSRVVMNASALPDPREVNYDQLLA